MKLFGILLLSLSVAVIAWAKPPKKSKNELDFLKHNWSLIPAGTVKIKNVETTVPDFYMLKTELSNLDYLNFLKDLKANGNEADYQKSLPDTTVWLQEKTLVKGYVNDYFRYPGFTFYPVVGLSHELALQYASWMEKAINKRITGSYKVAVRLPTEAEWVRAARGDKHEQLYPWEGKELRNKKGKLNANFNCTPKESTENIAYLEEIYGDSRKPNQFGIMNLAGNVAEMLDENGKTKGGSWISNNETLMVEHTETQPSPSANVGVRFVLTLVKK